MAIKTFKLPSGLEARLVKSRRSSLGDRPGSHFIVTVFSKDDPDDESSIPAENVPEEDAEAALVFAFRQMGEITKKSGAPGAYRFAINGPGAARRLGLHFHLIASDLGHKTLKGLGLEFVQLVSTTSFIVPIPPTQEPPKTTERESVETASPPPPETEEKK